MDREIPVSNRYIDRKMKQIQQKKHRQTLYNIKVRHKSMVSNNTFFKSSEQIQNKFVRNSSSTQENKNLEIERQNIMLFNKIANIIREKPKNCANRSYATSIEQSTEKIRRKNERIKTENQEYEKRISKQKSSIQNKLFYKDRQQNLRYLKFIGRYPYEPIKKSETESRILNEGEERSTSKLTAIKSVRDHQKIDEIEVYKKKTKDSFVRIVKICNSYYIFNVKIEGNDQTFKYTMPKNTYEQQLEKSDNSIEKLISKLRLTDDHTMIFQFS